MMKKLLAWVMTLAMVLSLVPAVSFPAAAADGDVEYRVPTYVDNDPAKGVSGWTTQTKYTGEYKAVTNTTTAWDAGWYVVNTNVEITGGVTLNGDVNLILMDGCTLTVAGVGGDSWNLTIWQTTGSGTGTLKSTVSGTEDVMGIAVENLTINGGTVTAKGSDTGICSADACTINSGTVEATGTWGISNSTCIINGGTVTAKGSDTGICSGDACTINGGTVTATGNWGIYSYTCTINGGTVEATGTGYGICSDTTCTIKGGTVEATGTDAGIYSYTCTIEGGTVEATGIGGGNGIYSEAVGTKATIVTGIYSGDACTINGGTVEATGIGDSNGYGIYSNKGVCTINSTLTVKAGSKANPTNVVTDEKKDGFADDLSGKQYVVITSPVSYLSPVYKDSKVGATSGLNEMKKETLESDAYTLVTASDSATTWNAGWYVVNGTVEIKGSVTCTGNVNLILTDGASLTVDASTTTTAAGIRVNGGTNSLTIYGQTAGTGKLDARGGSDDEEYVGAAGIGGGNNENGGNIIINGGTVTATGGEFGAGIGGGYGDSYGGSGSAITINGGTVNANGGADGGAGIGGGYGGSGSDITISGGTVTATGSNGGAGIGGGEEATGSAITINGGIVTATGGGTNVAGIGNGAKCKTLASGIKIAPTLTVKAGSNADATNVIEVENRTSEYNFASILEGKKYVTVELVYSLTGNSSPDTMGGVTFKESDSETAVTAAAEGDTITATATEVAGYTVALSVSENVTDFNVKTGTFTMPAGNVTVTATYTASHTHTWTYTADGAMLTATCSCADNAAGCSFNGKTEEERKVSLILSATGGTYSGNAYTATMDSTAWTGAELTVPTVVYYKADAKDSITEDGAALTKAPVNVGNYVAEISISDGVENTTNKATAKAAFSIDKAPLTITGATISDKSYDGTTTAEVTAVEFNGLQSSETLTKDTDYTVSGVFDHADATGTNAAREVTVTVTLKDTEKAKNYTISETKGIAKSISKADQTVSAPTEASKTTNSVTLTAATGGYGKAYYAKSNTNTAPVESSGDWQESTSFTGLSMNTDYYFFVKFAGDDNHSAVISGGTKITTLNHTHSWTYTASKSGAALEDNDTITATCSGEGTCSCTDTTLTIQAPAQASCIYDGTAKEATLDAATSFCGGTLPTITYEKKNGEQWEKMTDKPTEAGSYKAKITVGEDTGAATASVNYEITKATPAVGDFTYTAPDSASLTYDGSAKSASVSFNNSGSKTGMGSITVKYFSDEDCTTPVDPINAGTYYVGIEVAEGDNYKGGTTTLLKSNDWTFTITKAAPAASDFTYTPPASLTYDGSAKSASVSFNNSGSKTGMGSITVKYFSDKDCKTEVAAEDVKAAGIYYVGITVAEGTNYEATTSVLTAESWKFTIAKAKVDVPAVESFTYDRTQKIALTIADDDPYELDSSSTGNVTAATNAGSYSFCLKLKDKDNYEWNLESPASDNQSVRWSIGRRPVTLWSETVSKDYDGTALTALTVYADSSNKAVDSVFSSEVTGLAATGSATYVSDGEVSNAITYTFNTGCSENNYSITKTEGKLTVNRANTMSISNPGCEVFYDGEAHGVAAEPSVKNGTTVTYQTSTDAVNYSDWSETVPQMTNAGTLYVKAKAENPNYKDAICTYTLTVNPAKVDVPTAVSGLIYSGNEQTGVILPENAVYKLTGNTGKDAKDYTATAELTNTSNYVWNLAAPTSEDQSISWSIAKKNIQVKAEDKTSYVGAELVELTYTADELCGTDTFTGALATDADTNTAGEYAITQGDLAVNGNYNINFTSGTYTISRRSSGGGSTRTVNVTKAEDGKVTADKTSPAKGSTVTLTVTPDEGYTLDTLTVTDSKGEAITVTKVDDTTYTYTMPSSKVTVSADFVKEEDSEQVIDDETTPTSPAPSTGRFVDVNDTDYFNNPVDWAAEKGITTGKDETHFAPNDPCTRAQIVTFLWRAAGSPAPENENCPFTDVDSSAYYCDAVLWAVEKGITKGMTDTMFGVDNTCTRGQAVTFLHRYEGSQTATAENPFDDVKDSDFFCDAVLWANENNITNGTGKNAFSPLKDCTRGQIVTFLYRDMAE